MCHDQILSAAQPVDKIESCFQTKNQLSSHVHREDREEVESTTHKERCNICINKHLNINEILDIHQPQQISLLV